MLISHNHKLIYIHVHRTAGTGIMNMLKRCLDGQPEIVSEHGNMASKERKYIQNYASYSIIGFVRNPWDRILSWYSLIHGKQDIEYVRAGLERFLVNKEAAKDDDSYFHYNQLDYFPTLDVEKWDVQLFRYEDLEREIALLGSQLGIPLTLPERVNSTTPKQYQEYFTDQSREIVNDLCRKDIEFLRYSFF